MATKQIKMLFQVISDNGVDTNVVITSNGQEVFNGTLAKTVTEFVQLNSITTDTTPNSEVIFNIDVPNYVYDANVPYSGQMTNVESNITCTGGEVLLQSTQANWSKWFTPDTGNVGNVISHNGTVDTFVTCDIPVAPTFNGVVHPEMYNIDANYGHTGPGVLPVTSQVTVTHAVPPYSS